MPRPAPVGLGLEACLSIASDLQSHGNVSSRHLSAPFRAQHARPPWIWVVLGADPTRIVAGGDRAKDAREWQIACSRLVSSRCNRKLDVGNPSIQRDTGHLRVAVTRAVEPLYARGRRASLMTTGKSICADGPVRM